MSQPLTPTQIVNLVMPLIPSSMHNDILNTSTETAIKAFDLRIDDLSSFVDVAKKDDAANHYNTTERDASYQATSMLLATQLLVFVGFDVRSLVDKHFGVFFEQAS